MMTVMITHVTMIMTVMLAVTPSTLMVTLMVRSKNQVVLVAFLQTVFFHETF